MLGAIAIAPIAIHAPAVAVQPSRHAVWLAEHGSVLALANSLDEKAAEAHYPRLNELERLLGNTPAANVTEAKDKLRFAITLHEQGICLEHNDAAELMVDIGRFLL
jgi:hypothetical protein